MEQAKEIKGYHGAIMGTFCPGMDAEAILGEKYDKSFYGTACAYLLRRFGPAYYGCDSYKDLTSYLLTTKMEGVLLAVRPCCSVSTSFGYYLSSEIYKATVDAHLKARGWKGIDNCPVRAPVAKALREAIKELERPVNVRDWYFNITGRIPDNELEQMEPVEYSKVAGYGIIPEYYDRFEAPEAGECGFARPLCKECKGAGCDNCKNCKIHHKCFAYNPELTGCQYFIPFSIDD